MGGTEIAGFRRKSYKTLQAKARETTTFQRKINGIGLFRANFIVSEAPEEAALASEILNHSDTETTETYRKSALQIQASRRLAAAADAALRQISPPQVRLRQVAKRPGRAPRASRQ